MENFDDTDMSSRNNQEYEQNYKTSSQFMKLNVHVHDKVFNVSCGQGSQSLKWLAQVGIARWDEVNNQGWKRLGVPVSIRIHEKDGVEMDMSLTIKDILKNEDHVYVYTSLQPHQTL